MSVAVAPAPARSASQPRPGGDGRPWKVAATAPAPFLDALSPVHPVVAQLLFNRGLTTPEAARAFLASDADALHDPRGLYGMDRAIERLQRAFRSGETIAVHGDFDVDGVSATTILTEGLRAAGAHVLPYVPRRTTTGYGVQEAAVEHLAAAGARVLVTGDTGTRAVGAVRRAAQVGVDVVITDHHLPGAELPPAYAVVNPHLAQCTYPFKELSGSGVAWKLVHALELEGALGGFGAAALLDLVALGTIVDVSPLVGENRLLVQRGLGLMGSTGRAGLRALMASNGKAQYRTRLDERTVAFSIGPRLNAAGRMDSAELALELLLTRDPARAAELAGQLEQKNLQRQQLTERVLVAAREQAQGLADQPLLVLRGTDWPGGVIGLVAARIADEFGRPAVIVEVGPDACRGSGRSLAGFDLVEALTGCADLLVEYGGHSMAAGFAVLPGRLDALVERLVGAAAQMPAAYDQPVHVDVALAESDLDWNLHRALTALRPFGAGNPQPLFVSHRLRLLEVRTVGEEGRHLRLRLRCGRQVLTAFGPDLGHRAAVLRSAGSADALYSLDVSSWNGTESLELRLHDVRAAASLVA